jgi:hypothetical protein
LKTILFAAAAALSFAAAGAQAGTTNATAVIEANSGYVNPYFNNRSHTFRIRCFYNAYRQLDCPPG